MPSYPGASRGCAECRRRRKKCDLGSPSCRRCTGAGVDCSGPRASTTFIHRNGTNLGRQTDRMALLDAIQDRRGVRKALAKGHASPLNIPDDPALVKLPARMALLALVQDFQPLAPTKIFSADRSSRNQSAYSSMALCIRALLPLAALSWTVMDMSMFSLLSAYMGGLRGDTKLVVLAQSLYVSALRESHLHVQQVMAKRGTAAIPATSLQLLLLVTVALQAFELLNNKNNSPSALQAHVSGALNVLKMSGPETYQTEYLRQAFSGFRGIFLSVALEEREPTFLAQPQWIEMPFRNFQKTRRELLHDIALNIPVLLHRTDILSKELVDKNNGKLWAADAAALIVDYKTISENLRQWLQSWIRSENAPLYWHSAHAPSDAVQEVDAECTTVLHKSESHLCFQSSLAAGLLITYWSFQLELALGMDTTEQNLPATLLQPADRWNEADEIAQLIRQAAHYLSSCFEGAIIVKGPLQVIARFLRLRNNASTYTASAKVESSQSIVKSSVINTN